MLSLRGTLCRWITKYLIAPKLSKIDSLDETRRKVEKIAKLAKLPPRTRVEKTTIARMAAEWVYADTPREDRVILYLHGGGYNVCSPSTHRQIGAHISKASGASVLLIDYRLAPEHPFPAALEDAMVAYRWLLDRGQSGKHIAIAGDSAGGGLAFATAISIRDAEDPPPSSIACISPWTDLKFTGDSIQTNSKIDPLVDARAGKIMAENYIGDNDPGNPLISPLYAELSGLPPILVHVGTDEMLLDDAKRIAKRAQDAGVEVTLRIYDNLWHVFHLNVGAMPEAKTAVAEFGAFVAGHFE